MAPFSALLDRDLTETGIYPQLETKDILWVRILKKKSKIICKLTFTHRQVLTIYHECNKGVHLYLAKKIPLVS